MNKLEKSKNIAVQKFLDELREFDNEKLKMMQSLRKIVLTRFPDVSERMMYGGIMFSLQDDFGGIFVRKNHISFEFGKGVLIKDPDKLLEGTGAYRRHLKIRSMGDIKEKNVDYFVERSI